MSRPPRPFSNPARAVARSRPPADLTAEIATTRDGRDITRPWVGELEEFRDNRLLGAVDWGVYDRILLDDQVKSCLEQRRSAVVAREWTVIPGDGKDPRSQKAADALSDNLERLDWDGITDKMLYAPFYGVARAELIWEARDGLFQWSNVKVRHARRFREDKDGNLRLLTNANMRGELLPPRKFWSVTVGASDDDQPYGRGLAEWLYWPTLFKRNGVRFWNLFLDKFSLPPTKGVYPRGTSKEEIEKLLQGMMALANDSGIAVPEGVVLEFMNIATAGVDFEKLPRYMDEAIAKIVLSQTMTTDDGASLAQGKVHAGVKQELITADADLLSGSFNRGPARWFTDLNFGPDVAAPQLIRQVEEEEDLKSTAETDEFLDRMGFERTEESFKDVYGDGYRRKPTPVPAPAPATATAKGRDASADAPPAANDGEPPAKVANFAAGDPRSLYVHRRLKNAKALLAWARGQGFKSTLPAGELHVTIAYSRRPVDWFEMGQAWGQPDGGLKVPAGGPRQVERFDGGAVVLLFASSELTWRNQEMRDKGAEWSYADYHPHITLSYDAGGLDLAAVEAYRGELIFGPEIFEPVDDGYEIEEVRFAEPETGDIVDQATAEIMADEGWQQVADELGINELLAELVHATSEQDVADILAREAGMGDMGPLTERLARAGFAVRTAATVGEEGA